MEKPTLTKSDEFVLEQIFNQEKHEFIGYNQLIDELKHKVFDAFQKEDDLLMFGRYDDIPIENIFPNDDPSYQKKKERKKKK